MQMCAIKLVCVPLIFHKICMVFVPPVFPGRSCVRGCMNGHPYDWKRLRERKGKEGEDEV